MYIREIIIIALVIACGILFIQKQDAKHQAKETQLIHEKLIADQKRANAEKLAEVNEQRKIESEAYAIEINRINELYNSAMANSQRMHTEIKTYADRLHTVSREAVEGYAKTASTVYAECRSEYVQMGQYAARLDAELDKVTVSEK